MGTVTSTSTLAPGASRTFNLAPASAVSLTLLPNCRVTVTETPAVVASSPVGGNAPRVHNLRYAGVVTYGPYAMGGTIVVSNDSNSGSTLTWTRTDALIAEDASGAVSVVSADGNVLLAPRLSSMTMDFLGDSITAQSDDFSAGYGGASGDPSFSNYGWVTWFLAFAKADIQATIRAVELKTSADVIAEQLPATLAAKPMVTTLLVGINDVVSGTATLANIQYIAAQIMTNGGRLVLISPTPNNAMSSGGTRFSIIIAGMQALAQQYPAQIRFVNAYDLFSDPSDTDGDAYADVYTDLSHDETHPNLVGASMIGRAVYEAIADWVLPYRRSSVRNGLGINLLANPDFGGTGGALASAATNSIAPTSWDVRRGTANVTYGSYKSLRTPLRWVTATTYRVGVLIKPLQRNGCNYMVMTSAATGATRPELTGMSGSVTTIASAVPPGTVMWSTITPDVGGPVYMVVPEVDEFGTPTPGEELVLDAASTSQTASDYVGVRQDIAATTLVGQTLRASIMVRHMDSDLYGYTLKVRQEQTGPGGTKVQEAWGMAPNSFFGAASSPTLIAHPRERLLVVTPNFVVQPGVANLRFEFRIWPRTGSVSTRVAISDAQLIAV